MEEIGIYIHIPFCNSKCFYCDFCSVIYNEEIVKKYIEAIKKEILSNSEILSNYKISSVYFGGGTPSVIDKKYINEILDILKLYNISDNAEITIEVNPNTIDKAKLLAYKESGINRLSIGLQTIHNNTLRKIGRISTFEDFKDAYELVTETVPFLNISLDIITGLPNETLKMFNETINYIFSLKNINHISCYSLEVHENTKLNFLLKEKYLKLPTEEIERAMKHLLDNKAAEHGFERYEISNYAKKGYKSKHNLKYWTKVNYLGFGASAASFIDNTRYSNIDDVINYIECINAGLNIKKEIEALDLLAQIKEYIILRLRLKEGINIIDFKKAFKRDINDLYKQEIDKLVKEKLLNKENNNIYLTDKGEDLANIVWQEFI